MAQHTSHCLTPLPPPPTRTGAPSSSDTGTGASTGTGIFGSNAAGIATHRGMGTDDIRGATGTGIDSLDPDPSSQMLNQGRQGPGPGMDSGDPMAPDPRSSGDRYERSGADRASSYYQQQQQRQDYPMQQQQQQQSSSSGRRRGHGSNNYNYNSNGDRGDGRYQPSNPSSDAAVRNTNMEEKSLDFYPDDSYNGFESRDGEGERGVESERAAYGEGRRGREVSGGNSGALPAGRKTSHPSRSSGGKK